MRAGLIISVVAVVAIAVGGGYAYVEGTHLLPKMKAEDGDISAMLKLGDTYSRDGFWGGRDDAEAYKWYRMAADKGNAFAMNAIGEMTEKGKGIAHNDGEACKWYEKAADAGNPDAIIPTARCYDLGKTGKPDKAAAAKWFAKASLMGLPEAEAWIENAAKNGNPTAARELADAISKKKLGSSDPKASNKALGLYRLAAENGDVPAMVAMGESYSGMNWISGDIDKDYDQAMVWFDKAAQHGDAGGYYGIGKMYLSGGNTFPRDFNKAAMAFYMAARQGHALAMWELAFLYDGIAYNTFAAHKNQGMVYFWLTLRLYYDDNGDGKTTRELIARAKDKLTPDEIAKYDAMTAQWIKDVPKKK